VLELAILTGQQECLVQRSQESVTPRTDFDLPKLVILSTYAPTKCGLATFSSKLRTSLLLQGFLVDVIAIVPSEEHRFAQPEEVKFSIEKFKPAAYVSAAKYVEDNSYGVVLVQHEFGIFGNEGEYLMAFLSALRRTIVITTLHTIDSTLLYVHQRHLIDALLRSHAVVSLFEDGCDVVSAITRDDLHRTRDDVFCKFIPHGVPTFTPCNPVHSFAFSTPHKPFVIMAGGLLSPSKGVEILMDAMRSIIFSLPHALLVLVGNEHPDQEGYVAFLKSHAAALGITDHVKFYPKYIADDELEMLLPLADVYVCMHLNQNQVSSGTLVMAMAAGVVVVASPFAQAKTLVRSDTGILVPFASTGSLAKALVDIGTNPSKTELMKRASFELMKARRWVNVGDKLRGLILNATRHTNASGIISIDESGMCPLFPRFVCLLGDTCEAYVARCVGMAFSDVFRTSSYLNLTDSHDLQWLFYRREHLERGDQHVLATFQKTEIAGLVFLAERRITGRPNFHELSVIHSLSAPPGSVYAISGLKYVVQFDLLTQHGIFSLFDTFRHSRRKHKELISFEAVRGDFCSYVVEIVCNVAIEVEPVRHPLIFNRLDALRLSYSLRSSTESFGIHLKWFVDCRF
jgi:glycosyltransferase involved in cell wall biosynthesis